MLLSGAGGSSPLARGLRGAWLGCREGGGIIPARAGFTWLRPRPRSLRWDHPRSRGVYPMRAPHKQKRSGSSPLARGLHVLGFGSDDDSRIIPARAGFTSGPSE